MLMFSGICAPNASLMFVWFCLHSVFSVSFMPQTKGLCSFYLSCAPSCHHPHFRIRAKEKDDTWVNGMLCQPEHTL